jgi:FtsH-binding integral membrane protein
MSYYDGTNEVEYVKSFERSAVSTVLKNVYLWMTAALAISGLTAMVVAKSPAILSLIFANSFTMLGFFLAPFALVWFISARIHSLSIPTAVMLFTLYAVMMGVMLSSIFLAYTTASITNVFFITAGTFGAISLYGYTTKRDLSSWRTILLMGLIGLIIASLVNYFLNSEMLYWIISYVGVIIFVGLTAYDTQKIKQMALEVGTNEDAGKRVALLGALVLYLDFINLFLYLLRIFGDRD